jgi:hypothetical protein
MAASLTNPRVLPTTAAKIFFQLELPDVPGYVYHDRFDAYLARNDSKLSMLTFDLSTGAKNGHVLLGAAEIPFPLLENKELGVGAQWTKLNGLRGWHYNPASIEAFVTNVGKMHPSIMYRSVLVDGEYKIETGRDGYRVNVKVISLAGEKAMDDQTENKVPGGGRTFQVTFRKAGEAWHVVQTEGIMLQEGESETNW